MPEIERAASALFAEHGLADRLSRVLTALRDLEEGRGGDRVAMYRPLS